MGQFWSGNCNSFLNREEFQIGEVLGTFLQLQVSFGKFFIKRGKMQFIVWKRCSELEKSFRLEFETLLHKEKSFAI